MTTVRKELALDLFTNPSWPLFSRRARDKNAPDVAVCSLTWNRAEPGVTRDLQKHMVRGLSRLGLVLQILIVDETLQPRSAVVQYRKMWKSLPETVPQQITRGPEVQIDCDGGVRFAALATVPKSDIDWILTTMDSFDIVVPILRKEALPLDADTTRALACAGLPPNGCLEGSSFDWPGFVTRACQAGAIAMRQTRDDEISVDFFGSEVHVIGLLTAMEDDHDVS